MNNARKKAWETRRMKYGPRGHRGSYNCGNGSAYEKDRVHRMEDALIKLHNDGVLSEGQLAKITGLHRITLRARADDMRNENDRQ